MRLTIHPFKLTLVVASKLLALQVAFGCCCWSRCVKPPCASDNLIPVPARNNFLAMLPCAAHQVGVCCRAYEGPSCAVCLGNYESGEMIRQLPDCHHHFHQDCIDQWLATHTTCPMCRRSLLPPDPAVETPVSPSASPTAHLLPLWADHASRHQQHLEMAVELRPVGCPSPTIPPQD